MSPPILYVTYNAPVCPVSRDQALPGMPGRYRPTPPRALDLQSAIAAANALILALQPGVNQGASNGTSNGENSSSGYKPGQDTPEQDGGGGGPSKRKRWKEVERKKCKIKYFSMVDGKKDPNNWILVERLTYLRWHDSVQKIDFDFYWTYNEADPFEDNSEFKGGDKGYSDYEKHRRQAGLSGGSGG